MKLGTESLARASGRRPWVTVGMWVLLLLAAVAISSRYLSGVLTTGSDFTNAPESKRAAALLEAVRGSGADTEFVVVTADAATVADPEFQAYVKELETAIASLGREVVLHVGSYLNEEGPVSESGRSTLLPVALAVENGEAAGLAQAVAAAVAAVEAPEGFQSLVTGPATLSNDFSHLAEETLRRGEAVGLLVALVVLVLVFGAIAAGAVPIVLGMTAIGVAMGAAALAGLAFELSFFVTNMITMIGLAVGIDYSLFIVSRYREERAAGRDKLEAIAFAGATAGRTVFFSGMTVVLALLGLLLLPNTIFRSLGIGAILVVLIAIAASMTLLPALLAIMGDKVDALRVRRRSPDGLWRGRMWDRITRVVMGRPVLSLMASAGVLLAAAVAYFSIDTGLAGVSTIPEDMASRQGFEVLTEEFAGGLGAPVEIVVNGEITPAVERSMGVLQATLAADPAFGPSSVQLANAGSLAVVSVALPGDVNGNGSLEAVRQLRGELIPAAFADTNVEVLVGGETAITVDFLDQTSHYTPIVFVFVLGLSFVLLTVAFRSVVIPCKAIAMNLLSVGAAYGMVVLFFQQGVGPAFLKEAAAWLGFRQVEAIEAWLPLFLFSVLFGLSMDYHVFLLSRIRERFDHSGDNAESVAYGLRTTGALITGAAAIMVAVFAGFAAGRLVPFQQMGFGLAIAVLLDATIVRSVLVPASMRLLGHWNWYLPSWLEWLPHLSIEGTREKPEPPTPDEKLEKELVLAG